MLLKNEFALVRVELDRSGNGPRLMIRDERAQRAIYLDPLELQSLAWRSHRELALLLDPSVGPWSEESDGEGSDVLKVLELES